MYEFRNGKVETMERTVPGDLHGIHSGLSQRSNTSFCTGTGCVTSPQLSSAYAMLTPSVSH